MSKNQPSFKTITANKLRSLAAKIDTPAPSVPLTMAEAAAMGYLLDIGHVTNIQKLPRFFGLDKPHYRIEADAQAIVLTASTYEALMAGGRITDDFIVTEKGRGELEVFNQELYGEDLRYVRNPLAAS